VRRSPLGIGFTVVSFAAIVAVFLVPKNVQWIALIVAVLLILANVGEQLLQFRAEARAVTALIAAYPETMARPTSLTTFGDLRRPQLQRVGVVFADRSGLSFRTPSDAEVARVDADRILSIELAPLDRRVPIRPAVVTTIDGSPVAFTVGANQDAQAEAIVALRKALGRSPA
jgi:hypothetical protein